MSEIVNDADEIVRRYKVTIDYITKEYDRKLKEKDEEVQRLKSGLFSFNKELDISDWERIKKVFEEMSDEQKDVLYTLCAQAVRNDRISIINSLEKTLREDNKNEQIDK